MTDHIAINPTRLVEVLDEMRRNGATTALTTDIIDKYMGGFHSNEGVPVVDSWNAQFGKYLKSNREVLRISENKAGVRVKVNGVATSASKWNLNPGG